MKRLLILLLAGAATPALAQNSGQAAPAASAPSGTCTPEHAAMGHCTIPAPAAPSAQPSCTPEHAAMGHCTLPADAPPAAPAQTEAPAADPTCPPEHAAMGHCTPRAATPPAAAPPIPAPATDPTCPPEHAAMGHCTPKAAAPAPAAADPHAGHAMPAAPASGPACPPEHAAMGHCTPKAGAALEIPVGPPPPAARRGPEHAADAVWNPAEMVASRETLRAEHGNIPVGKILIDQLEWKNRDGKDGYGWDAQAWYGGDINKVWFKTEGEGVFGEGLESAEIQTLWSRAVDPWFDLQLGVRYDISPNPERGYLVAGIQGLAPYWFEVDGSVFLSNKGDLTARFEGEYDLRITQQLILQPLVEFDLAAQDVPELGIGSGLSEAAIGARLRYEILTGSESGPASIAPYVGVEYERAFGDTADFRRAAGEKAGGLNFLVGVRTWF